MFQIGRYPGIGPRQPVEGNWEIVAFAVIFLLVVYALSAILLALLGFRGEELILVATTIGAPVLMVLAGVFFWWKTRRASSPLTDSTSLDRLVHGS